MAGLSLGHSVSTGGFLVDVEGLPPSALGLLNLSDGTIEITADPDMLTITITGTAQYDGVYMIDPADLETGPVNLVAPQLQGTPESGQTLSALPGLWLYDSEATAPTLSAQWHRNGAGIAGEGSPAYVVLASDGGSDLSYVETCIQIGQRVATSNILYVPEAAGTMVSDASVNPTRIINPDGDGQDYDLYEFLDPTAANSITFAQAGDIDIQMIGGGGPGGGADANIAPSGGGGAGRFWRGPVTAAAQTHILTIGAGGLYGTDTQGGDTTGFGITMIGGGRGASERSGGQTAIPGGSGGGGGDWTGGATPYHQSSAALPGSGQAGLGNPGGNVPASPYLGTAGGGGGAEGPGQLATSDVSGSGGAGIPDDITGAAVICAEGGGGGAYAGKTPGTTSGQGGIGGGQDSPSESGLNGTGSGGGGKGFFTTGGHGGHGAIRIRVAV